MMNIVTPISSPSELEMLLHNGADELYCGLKTPEWDEIFGQGFWMNRRSPDQANLRSFDELETIVSEAQKHQVTVSITLNAPFYPEKGMTYLLTLCKQLADMDVHAVIVSDLNLLSALSHLNLPIRIHLSSLGSCFNSHAVDFYRSLGVRRIILPRQLTPPEIRAIALPHAETMEFEVFALNDGCYFEEGFCQTSHALGPFCLTDWNMEPIMNSGSGFRRPMTRLDGKSLSTPVKNQPEAPEKIEGIDQWSKNLDKRKAHFKEYLWFQNNCGSSFQQNGLPNGPCSLCLFGEFKEWGVTALKIVGREASFHRKMGSLQLVKAVRDKTDQWPTKERIKTYARELRQTPEKCDSGYMCYFRDA